MNSILIGQLHNNNTQASWANIQSLSGLGYCIGGGLGNNARTAVSNYIGKGEPKQAKEYAIKSLVSNFLLAVIWSICVILLREDIAEYFSEVEDVKETLKGMLFVFGFIELTDMLMSTSSC